MSSPSWKKYQDLLTAEPDLFRESSGGYRILPSEEAVAFERAETGRLRSQNLPEEWGRLGVVFEDQYIRVIRDAVLLPSGQNTTYIRILPARGRADGVAVLPLHRGSILLLRHYRHATRDWHLEIPRGFGEKALTPMQNASRELREEIGNKAERLTQLGEMYPDTGLMGHKTHLFCAIVDEYEGPQTRAEAIATIVQVSTAEFEKLFAAGAITDSFTICAFAWARQKSLL